MTIRRQAIQGVVWSAVQSWGTALLGMLTFLVLARMLEPDDFGLLALAFACIALLDILLRGGFGQAIVQRREITPAHLDTAFWLNVAVGVATATVAVAVAGVTANAFGQPDLGVVQVQVVDEKERHDRCEAEEPNAIEEEVALETTIVGIFAQDPQQELDRFPHPLAAFRL